MDTHADSPARRRAVALTGRRTECAVLDRLVGAVTAGGSSRALVLHGEAGAGKSALLDYLAAHAPGCQVVRATGVQSEMELAFAGLHQLCAPMLGRVDYLAAPQRDALRVAFGLESGVAPDRFMIGLGVLSLLSDAAERQPVICLVDDEQWLDRASAQVLAFVARRLRAESVGVVFAVRTPGDELAGLPTLAVAGLPDDDARALLDAALGGPIDARVADQIVAETRGNPLALLELTRGLTAAQLAGGFGLPGALPLEGCIESGFRRRVEALPAPTRTLLLLAAADPTGDAALVWRAARELGIGSTAAAAGSDAALAEFDTRVRFRHPLARSAAYLSASALDRRRVHGALADCTDQRLDPDRRAWHRAQAASGPDEDAAAELECSADRARARGGLAAASAFLKQAATLTLDPVRRAERALAAARAEIRAGAFDEARELLAMAETGPLTATQHAHVDLMRAHLAFNTSRGGEAPVLLVKAARRLEPVDPDLSRATYLDALSAAIFANRLADPGGDVGAVSSAAIAAPAPSRAPRAPDLLLDGTAAALHAGYAAGVPLLRRALTDFDAGLSVEEELRWMWLANVTAIRLWDDERWDALSTRYLSLARASGALSELPLALTSRAYLMLYTGDLSAAASLVDELKAVKEATGSRLAPYCALGLAALRGDEKGASALIEATISDVTGRGEGIGIVFAEWANAMLHNGLGRYDKALAAGIRATGFAKDIAALTGSLFELVEAGARCRDSCAAAGAGRVRSNGAGSNGTGSNGTGSIAIWAYERLSEMAEASGTEWLLGVQARSHALLSEGEEAEYAYRESIARFGKTRLRVDLARVHLLYGEWLRRERRRHEAREHLRTARDMLERMGIAAFADRAARELRATGESARRRDVARDQELTAQEAQVARLARDGLSNPEIATRLFLSAHTVQYHLRKVFAKLGVTSRSQLDRVLPSE